MSSHTFLHVGTSSHMHPQCVHPYPHIKSSLNSHAHVCASSPRLHPYMCVAPSWTLPRTTCPPHPNTHPNTPVPLPQDHAAGLRHMPLFHKGFSESTLTAPTFRLREDFLARFSFEAHAWNPSRHVAASQCPEPRACTGSVSSESIITARVRARKLGQCVPQ